jgi:hypothetical protein
MALARSAWGFFTAHSSPCFMTKTSSCLCRGIIQPLYVLAPHVSAKCGSRSAPAAPVDSRNGHSLPGSNALLSILCPLLTSALRSSGLSRPAGTIPGVFRIRNTDYSESRIIPHPNHDGPQNRWSIRTRPECPEERGDCQVTVKRSKRVTRSELAKPVFGLTTVSPVWSGALPGSKSGLQPPRAGLFRVATGPQHGLSE